MRKYVEETLPRGVRKRGNSLIVTFALADGTIERRSLGPVSVQYAKQQRAIFQREVSEGRYQKAKPKAPRPTVYRCADLWDAYLREYQNQGKRDAGRLEIAWDHLKTDFEKLSTAEVTTDCVNRYIERRRGEGKKNATINRETATLRAMFHHGSRQTPPMVDRMPSFPTRLKESAPRTGFIGDAEYAKLKINAKPLWLRSLVACAYTYGFRKSELLNLLVRQVDLLDKWLALEEGTTKNGESRKVRMTAEVYELMCACVRGKKPDSFVFTREDGARVVDPRDDWYNLSVVSGLGEWVPAKRKNGEEYKRYVGLNLHDFRRSAIRNMTRRGVNETVAMKISGHKTASVFRRYDITDERDLAEATRKIEAGRQEFPADKSDTKTDTSGYAHS